MRDLQMNKFRRMTLPLIASVCLLGVAGCDSSSSSNLDPAPAPTPATPMQVDQMARAGINTAVTDPFFRSDVEEEDTRHGQLTDAYNSDTSASSMVTGIADRFAGNLAIYDGADTVCGDQLLADDANPDGRYATLASVLADDQIYVNSESGTCDQYLGVELTAVGVDFSGDCGGRTPAYDVIDTTYSAITVGMTSGVTDGIDSDGDSMRGELELEGSFPFLAAPVSMAP